MVVKRNPHDDRYMDSIRTLQTARSRAGVSQSALAEKLGRKQQFVSKYESGERRLDLIEFIDVAKALEMSFDEALGNMWT